MSTAPKEVLQLQAGVEHELVFASEKFIPPEGPSEVRDVEARKWIAKLLEDVAGLSVESKIEDTKVRVTPDVYKTKWTLPFEPGLSSGAPGEYDLELASPVADIRSDDWIKQTTAIYTMFRDLDITIQAPPDTCATHVHISPSAGAWTMESLKSISKAIVYFERCTDALIAAPHLNSAACKNSNFASALYQSAIPTQLTASDWRTEWDVPFLRHESIQMLWDRIDTSATKDDITRLMCSLPRGSEKPQFAADLTSLPPLRREHPELTRNHRWNYLPLLDESAMKHSPTAGSLHVLGTLEFKQPEGSATAEQAIAWRLFATGFVQAALGCAFDRGMAEREPTVHDLRVFVEHGVEANGCSVEGVRAVFERGPGAEASKIWFEAEAGFEEYRVTRSDGQHVDSDSD